MLLSKLQSAQPLKPQSNRAFKDIFGLLERDGRRQREYRIRFVARSSLFARLGSTRFNANVNLELLDSNKRLVAFSKRIANRPELIEEASLAPGTYYLRAELVRGKWSRFRLRASTTPNPDTSNQPNGATFLDVTSTPLSVGEFVGAEDRADFYSFNIGGTGFPTGQLNLALAGANGGFLDSNVTVRIRNSNFNVVRERTSSGRTNFSFTEPLAAGTYFVEVAPASATRDETNYQLTLSSTTIPDLAGNTPNAARRVELSPELTPFQDFVGVGDLQDYYRFTIPKGKFDLQLTAPNGNLLNGDVTVRLRDSVNTVLEEETVTNGAGVSINNKNLAAGTYVVQISTASRFVNYSLAMAADPT
jgi:hypothetical protein